MPIILPAIGAAAGWVVRRKVWIAATGAVATTFYVGDKAVETVFGEEASDDLKDALIEAGATVVDEVGDAALSFVEGFGSAVVRGVDNAYDAIRAKLRGREPDVIAGLVIASLSILTVVYLYHSAKAARDAF